MKIFVSNHQHGFFTHIIQVAIPHVHDRTGAEGFLVVDFNVDEAAPQRVRSEHVELALPEGMHEVEWPDDHVQAIINGFYAMMQLRWDVLHT